MKNKDNKKILLEKTKLSRIEALISKSLTDSYISNLT